jgi:hypothetical protein
LIAMVIETVCPAYRPTRLWKTMQRFDGHNWASSIEALLSVPVKV